MIQNYFRIAFRNLLKNKIFSLINILGLAIGMAACLLILQYVRFELSYDDFHEHADRIYRVQHNRYIEGELQYQRAQAFIPTGEAMKSEFPEVQDYTTLFPISEQSDIIMTYQTEQGDAVHFSEKAVYHVKGNFLEIFTFPIIEGSQPSSSLAPNTVLISASMAKKYFGQESPIGKTLSHNYASDYKIVGVFEDIPKNSHLKLDFLFAWMPITDEESGGDANNWRWDGFFTYLLLTSDANVAELEAKLPDFINKRIAGQLNEAVSSQLVLQPLTDIHLYSHLQGEAEPNGEASVVYALLALAVFVLIIAWINYVNLATSRSLDRAKEIGVRKAIGSGKIEIVKQFLVESLLVNLLALMVALTLVQVLSSSFSNFTGAELSQSPELWAGVLVLLLVGSGGGGLYPALIISAFEPAKALKGKYHEAANRSFFSFRHGLVIFQFTISISLMAASLLVYKQLSFMKTQRLGISLDNTLVVNTQATFGPPGSDSLLVKGLTVLKNRLETYSVVKGTTVSYDIPGKEHLSTVPHFRHVKNPEELVSLYLTRIDEVFIPTFGAKLLAGNNFSPGMNGRESMIVNVEALRALGLEDPQEAIGQELIWGNQNLGRAKIIGVVDFRATSFKSENLPVAYITYNLPLKYLSVKFDEISGQNASANIALVKQVWEEVFPEKPFDYFFLDDFFNRQYQQEQRFSQLLGLFTLLAIVVACLGLYAVASLTVTRRIKEVGVRKILGAPVHHLLLLLSRKFLLLIIVAGGISLPLIQIALRAWLETYPYRTDLSWWVIALPVVCTLLLTIITISHQIIRASIKNPVESLRYE